MRRTRCLDELSDDDEDDGVDIDDLDDLNDVGVDVAHQLPLQKYYAAGSPPPRKFKEEPHDSESFEGTSILSSNPSLLSSNQSFVSSVSSSDGSLPFTLSSSSAAGLSGGLLSRHNSGSSDLQFSSSRGPRGNFSSSSSSNALKRTASMTPQEADDLEQTFRLRMMLFPDESAAKSASVTHSLRSQDVRTHR